MAAICCTMSDLFEIVAAVKQQEIKFDHLVLKRELADPAPVISELFMDEDVQAKTNLDSVVTVVDATHQRWGKKKHG